MLTNINDLLPPTPYPTPIHMLNMVLSYLETGVLRSHFVAGEIVNRVF